MKPLILLPDICNKLPDATLLVKSNKNKRNVANLALGPMKAFRINDFSCQKTYRYGSIT